jgi:hypothetical protein
MIASSSPAWAVWLALGLWGVAIVVGVVAFVTARRLWRQVKPMVEPYLIMFAGPAKVDAAAGTGSARKSADSSPAAVVPPDRCEYDDHEWKACVGRWDSDDKPAHYCLRCGFAEQMPGT